MTNHGQWVVRDHPISCRLSVVSCQGEFEDWPHQRTLLLPTGNRPLTILALALASYRQLTTNH